MHVLVGELALRLLGAISCVLGRCPQRDGAPEHVGQPADDEQGQDPRAARQDGEVKIEPVHDGRDEQSDGAEQRRGPHEQQAAAPEHHVVHRRRRARSLRRTQGGGAKQDVGQHPARVERRPDLVAERGGGIDAVHEQLDGQGDKQEPQRAARPTRRREDTDECSHHQQVHRRVGEQGQERQQLRTVVEDVVTDRRPHEHDEPEADNRGVHHGRGVVAPRPAAPHLTNRGHKERVAREIERVRHRRERQLDVRERIRVADHVGQEPQQER
jgi:hypothetical protein